MGFGIIAVFAIFGGALVIGGIVAFRSSRSPLVRTLAAAGIAAGLVMVAIIFLVIPVSSETQVSPAPPPVKVAAPAEASTASGLSETDFRALLTLQDVKKVQLMETDLESTVRDFKTLAGEADPTQVEHMESWYGLTFASVDGSNGLTMTVMDFDSPVPATAHWETVMAEATDLRSMASSIGDRSASAELAGSRVERIVMALDGRRLILLHTAQPPGQEPLVSRGDLEKLARLVADRLATAG